MECNDCRFYDVLGGICTKLNIYVLGHELACNDFEQRTKVRWNEDEEENNG